MLWLVLLGGPTCALLAVITSTRQGSFRAIDVGTLLFPAVVFFVVALQVGSQKQGLGLVLWPLVVALVSSYAFALKVFVADRALGLAPFPTSRWLFVAMSASALAFAFLAPVWLD